MPKNNIVYLAKVDMAYTSGNKLEQTIKDMIYTHDRELIDSKNLEKFKRVLVNKIETLNKQYPRCTAVRAEWWTPANHADKLKDWALSFHGRSVVSFHLYAGRVL